jgi:hypothetical protein
VTNFIPSPRVSGLVA